MKRIILTVKQFEKKFGVKIPKPPTPRIKPINKKDKEKAKIMQKILDYEYKKHQEFIDALIRARLEIEAIYGIQTPDQPWDLVLSTYYKQQTKKGGELIK